MTLGEWCQDKSLCTQSQNVLTSPIVRQMIQVLHNSHPAFQVFNTGGKIDTNDRAMHQAKCEGYTNCLADFESMGHYASPTESVEAAFDAEEISEIELAPFKADGKRTA